MPGKTRPPPKGFSDPHGTISNIGYFPDQQQGYGNCGFQDLVYRPESQPQPSLLGGGIGGMLGGIVGGIGSMLGGKTPVFNREAQPPASCPAPAPTGPKTYSV
ncbi:MAG: hypothetical protein H6738_18945 [Alphaproteobacteria bacterium]|nr:hypothetical protein [Alphaproteobacteria bacterium]MCB9698866.1 hypothetical protein [Alphaproteobacteria bacterium]